MKHLMAVWLFAIFPVLHAQPIRIRTQELPKAIVGTAYHETLETAVDGRCPDGDVGLHLGAGALPRGLAIRGDYLLGTPVETGTFQFRVRVDNTCAVAEKAYALVVTGKPILKVYPEELAFAYHTGEPNPAPQTVLVSSDWPGLPYLVQAIEPWLNCAQRAGVTPELGSAFAADRVAVRVSPANLKPGIYYSELSVSTWLGANTPVVRVTLTVAP